MARVVALPFDVKVTETPATPRLTPVTRKRRCRVPT